MMAMLRNRSFSVPPNPFWSERQQDEMVLQRMRPRNLPQAMDGEGVPVPSDGGGWEEHRQDREWLGKKV